VAADANGGKPETAGRLLEEFARLVDGISVVMVTTVAGGETLRSRPMLVERVTPDGTITFLTHLSSQKVDELHGDPRVNVAFVSPDGDRYLSVAGIGAVARDPACVHELWKPTYRAWFPGGPDDPDAAVLTVRMLRIDYWDVPTSRLVRLWSAVRAVATGTPVEAERQTWVKSGQA
jgi:general stress protein 26